MKKCLLLVFAVFFITEPSFAAQVMTFGPQGAVIEGSIKYTVLGHYVAHFNHFKGRLVLGDHARVESVYLEIQANSIESTCAWCDRAAKSRRLLNTHRFPKIVFKSDQITSKNGTYLVKGILQMHGIRRRMMFPFEFNKTDLRGKWVINRKDFNIVWNKYLDHGGVLVGDYFTVTWGIKR